MTDASNIEINQLVDNHPHDDNHTQNNDISGNRVKLLEEKRIRHIMSLRDVVMRQTDYNEQQSLDKIKEFNGDVLAIVREYMGVSKNVEVVPPKSTNQFIMSEIRNMMDDASSRYRYKKEVEENRKIMIENMMEANKRKEALQKEALQKEALQKQQDQD
jgi:hypothetical protein